MDTRRWLVLSAVLAFGLLAVPGCSDPFQAFPSPDDEEEEDDSLPDVAQLDLGEDVGTLIVRV